MDITVSDEVSREYHELVKNILCNREFLKLSLYTHHQWTTRLMHSINVSYLSWFIARKLGCDEKAAARAGLLHDFCPYDFRAETPTGEHQAFYHPKAAADNSASHFDVTNRELDAILSHMFPLGPLPRNKEAWIISIADKACAIAEGFHIAIALARRKNALPFAAVSMGLCSLALLGQIFEYNVRVYAQDFSALLDTSFAIRFCAVVLFLLAAVVNAGVCMYQMKRSVKQHPQH